MFFYNKFEISVYLLMEPLSSEICCDRLSKPAPSSVNICDMPPEILLIIGLVDIQTYYKMVLTVPKFARLITAGIRLTAMENFGIQIRFDRHLNILHWILPDRKIPQNRMFCKTYNDNVITYGNRTLNIINVSFHILYSSGRGSYVWKAAGTGSFQYGYRHCLTYMISDDGSYTEFGIN